jgi:hypothetical protein
MNYNAGDAHQPMKNVTPGKEDGNSEVKGLTVEDDKEY